jgi:hypothetical protein
LLAQHLVLRGHCRQRLEEGLRGVYVIERQLEAHHLGDGVAQPHAGVGVLGPHLARLLEGKARLGEQRLGAPVVGLSRVTRERRELQQPRPSGCHEG